jgi:hypothetical protein
MTLEDRLRDHLQSTDAEAPAPSVESIRSAARRRSTRNRVVAAGAAAVAGVALFVGAASLVNEPSVVDLAGTTRTTMTSDGEAARQLADESTAPTTTAPTEALAEASAELGDGLPGFQRPLLIGVDDGFAGVQLTDAGVVALRSSDGVNFSESPTSGFPDTMLGLQGPLVHDGEVFGVLAIGEDSVDRPGFIALSRDLAEWTVQPLPPADGDGVEAFVQSVAIADGTVVAVGATFPRFVDPVILAADLGLIDGGAVERNCGAIWDGPDATIEIVDCDGGDPLAVIPPGTPEHAEIFAAVDAPGSERVDIIVWTGGADRPFEVQRLAAQEFASPSVLADADGFVLFDIGAGTPAVRRSADGVVWGEPSEVGGDGQRLVSVGGTVASLGFIDGSLIVQSLGAGDVEATGVEVVEVGNDSRFGWIVGIASGPGGAAVLLQGSTESLAGSALDSLPERVTITVDGYTLVTDLESAGPFVVTGPDGTVIHDLPEGSSIFDDADDLDGVARFEGVDDERLVILDPVTGDELFSVTQEEFVAAMGLDPSLLDPAALDADEVIGGVVPTQALMFTTGDGTWRRIDDLPPAVADSFLTLEAVGDDEVLLRIERIVEPPDIAFLAEDGEFTAEQQAAMDAWERAQQDAAQLVRVPVG